MPRELLFETESRRFVVHDYTLPPLAATQVQVRITLAAPKHGTEAHGWSGDVNRGRRWDPHLRLFLDPPTGETPVRPSVMGVGNMAVGVVTAVGPMVERVRPGDHVYGYMPVREVHQCAWERVHILPVGLTPEAAVCIDPAHVAFVAIRDGKVGLGDDVAVFGLGAIGLLTVQAAHAAGARRIVAIDLLAARRERALTMGATIACDPAAGEVGLAIKQATQAQGVDVAIETSGADRALHEAIRCLRQCGTVVGVGWGSGTGAGLFLGEEFHVNRPTIVASQASTYWGNPDRLHPLWDEARAQNACADLFCRGALSPLGILDPIVSLAEAPHAMQAIHDDPARVLKIGIRLEDGAETRGTP